MVAGLHDIPEVSRLHPDDPHGHLQELREDPIGLLQRVRDECGDIGRFRLADRDVVLVSGAEANETFFRAPDEVLDQAEAYPFMTPIFGKGVVFDASPGASARRCSRTRPCAASRCAATPRRSRTRSAGWWRTGATRARSTCSTGSPS